MTTDSSNIDKTPPKGVEKWSLPSMNATTARVFRNDESIQPGADKNAASNAIPRAGDIERWHSEAYQEGYQQGLKKADQETRQLQKRLHDLISFFEQPLQSLNDEVIQQLHLLAVTLAQQLVRREIRVEPGEIIALIKESVQVLPASARGIKIYLHPEDAELVRSALQMDESEEEKSWKLVEDPMITRGGCEIKSDKSVINATLENRLQVMAASVLGGERIEDQGEVEND